MPSFQVWAQPWWVNPLLLIPLATYFAYRRKGSALRWRQLIIIAIFAAAFGFVEAVVVVYLRAAIGLLPGYTGTFAELRRSSLGYTQASSLAQFPQSLLTIEVYREVATMVMLIGVALLSATKTSARWAAFLWVFALWDIAYYAGLWVTVRWPASFTDLDVLFLIPVPWIAQVWFPLLISLLTVVAIALSSAGPSQRTAPDAKSASVGYS
ncbi:MAG: hypothetical protein WB711_11630 [Terriglobales bacterium]